jgi:hypothetical protein
MVKIKAHLGEPLNENADTVAERARQLPEDSKQWTTRTPRLLYEWTDKGVKRVSTWSKAVRTADKGWGRVQQAAGAGVTSDLMDSKRWGWECMIQLQERQRQTTRVAVEGHGNRKRTTMGGH